MTEFELLVARFMVTGMDQADAEEAAAIATGESDGCLENRG